eukprot:TRINITY_DN61655_c0_g1_i1.p1 TRINITY_DN61655_c0_g1~~TRINITY_DN61655_c0_g1_i1.p1  ORF type:complete len:458 (+),score=106.20 TRINITY_DN61655_c0_g1_i1:69-1442(+)
MFHVLWNILRDLYVVLLIIFVIEQVPGSDLLHDMTRKGIITVTIGIVAWKLFGGLLLDSSPPGGPRAGGPRRQKKAEGGKGQGLEWAACEMQGWRAAMEDATCIVTSLPEPLEHQALFAVFDGHGGSQVSHIASKEFPKVLTVCANKLRNSAALNEEDVQDAGRRAEPDADEMSCTSTPDKDDDSENEDMGAKAAEKSSAADKNGFEDHLAAKAKGGLPGKSLSMSMIAMDSFLRQLGSANSNASAGGNLAQQQSPLGAMARHLEANQQKNAFNLVGSTAIVALIDCAGPSRRVTVANCGDSRALLCRAGKAIELSEDHKPELAGESQRIRQAGGCVKIVGPCHRIDGWGLNLSRALGDFHYKARSDLSAEQQKVIAVPEIRTLDLIEEDEFMVLACDGCFELHTSQNVIDIVRVALKNGMNLEEAAAELVDQSCSPNLQKTRGKGGDNCSAIVIRL